MDEVVTVVAERCRPTVDHPTRQVVNRVELVTFQPSVNLGVVPMDTTGLTVVVCGTLGGLTGLIPPPRPHDIPWS